ncbi:HGxxPAAW family protein [Streptomyces sp. NPDC001156]
MSDHHDEGHTIAGWSGFSIATVGATVVGAGVVGWRPGIWLGSAIMAAAALVVWVLHLAGWGKPPGPRPADQWGAWVRDRTVREGHPGCLGCRLAGRRGATTSTDAAFEPSTSTAHAEAPADAPS